MATECIAGLLFLISALSFTNAHAAPARVTCKDCNVILISIDTLRRDRFNSTAPAVGPTPNLNAFAKNGLVFDDAIAAASWTLPSHVAMLTGYYPQHLGVELAIDALPDKTPLLARILAAQGYTTAAFSNGAYVNRAYGFDKGFQTFNQTQTWKDASLSRLMP